MNDNTFRTVRTPMLVAGVSYRMMIWAKKERTFSEVQFLNLTRDGAVVEGKLPKLNCFQAADKLNFLDVESGVQFVGVMRDCKLVDETSGLRLTFATPVVAGETVVEDEPAEVAAEVAPEPEVVADETPVESASERKNRKRREARAAAKLAQAA